MRAIVVNNLGGPDQLGLASLNTPEITDDQVLIDVHYAGINFPDSLIIQGKYQFQPPLPFSPGGEVSGIVSRIGKNITHLKEGDRVISGCGWGGYAEQVASFGTNTLRLPDELPLREGAILLQTYATTYHALVDRGQVKEGETLLVMGAAGGTGTSAIQLGKALGMTVIGVASTEEKRAYCTSQGADYVLDPTDTQLRDKIQEITNRKGLDVIYDPVGGPLSETLFRSLRFGGRHLVIGFAQGEIPRLPWNLPLLKSASIVGVFWGGFFREYPEKNAHNIEQLFGLWKKGEIHPVVDKELPLAEALFGISQLMKREVKGKMVINVRI
jgi:NADPH2:quinone reductase